MRRGAGTGLALAGHTEVSDVCVCEGSWLPAEPEREDRPETRGWGPDALGGAVPSLTQPFRPPQPQERELWGRRFSGHLRVSEALMGVCLQAPPLSLGYTRSCSAI